MKVIFFDTHQFEKTIFLQLNKQSEIQFEFTESRLNSQTASMTKGFDAVCSFVNDRIDADTIEQLKLNGIQMIALRSAGFNHVDLKAAQAAQITVSRVPGYSPHAVAEFAVGLLLSLNRKIHRAYSRVREMNFSLDGLVGFDLNQKTIGVIGTGKIGKVFVNIMLAFGSRILIHDLTEDMDLKSRQGVEYVSLEELCRRSDVISLHVPLSLKTHHMIDAKKIEWMKKGVLIINTGRGALIDAQALIGGLKSGHIGGAALDVYEEEEAVFFHDHSEDLVLDDVLSRLITFPNVLMTSHQAFLTTEALSNIAQSTISSLSEFEKTKSVSAPQLVST